MQITDYMVIVHKFNNDVKKWIPTREDSKENSVMNEEELSVFTNSVGAGDYMKRLNIQKSYWLKDGCNILQAELLALMKATKHPELRNKTGNSFHNIYGQPSFFKNFGTKESKIKGVTDWRETSSWVRGRGVSLCWVPGENEFWTWR